MVGVDVRRQGIFVRRESRLWVVGLMAWRQSQLLMLLSGVAGSPIWILSYLAVELKSREIAGWISGLSYSHI